MDYLAGAAQIKFDTKGGCHTQSPRKQSFIACFDETYAPAPETEAGFTLIEMLVVITIIGLIMSLVGPRVLNYLADSKIKTAKIQIESLSAAVDLYYLDLGHYPSSSDGLDALVRKPAGDEGWNGPYIRSSKVPEDPWGNPYTFKVPGDDAPYEIASHGPAGAQSAERYNFATIPAR